jgi:hypothetical protein
VEEDWTYPQKFDFIHGRALITCFKDPAAVFRRAYDALAPGGYFEMQDVYFKPISNDGTVDGTMLQVWSADLIEGARRLGRDWHCVLNYAQWFREIGFENVVEWKSAWPQNTWPRGEKQKTLGLWNQANALDSLNAVTMAMMTRSFGWTAADVELRLVDVRRDVKDKSIHAYYPM